MVTDAEEGGPGPDARHFAGGRGGEGRGGRPVCRPLPWHCLPDGGGGILATPGGWSEDAVLRCGAHSLPPPRPPSRSALSLTYIHRDMPALTRRRSPPFRSSIRLLLSARPAGLDRVSRHGVVSSASQHAGASRSPARSSALSPKSTTICTTTPW